MAEHKRTLPSTSMYLNQSNIHCSSITHTSFVSVVSNLQQQIYSMSLQLGDNLERSRTLLHYFYCESFVHLLVFDALLSLTRNSCKYQILFESFLILVVLRVSFPPCTNKKIKTEIGYKYERVLASKEIQNKPLLQGEIFHVKFWTAPLALVLTWPYPWNCSYLLHHSSWPHGREGLQKHIQEIHEEEKTWGKVWTSKLKLLLLL